MDHCSGALASVSSTELRESCAGRKQCQGFQHTHEKTISPAWPRQWVNPR